MLQTSLSTYQLTIDPEKSIASIKVKTSYQNVIAALNEKKMKIQADQAMMLTFQRIVEKEEIFVASDPHAKLGMFSPETDFEYTITLEVVIPPFIDPDLLATELSESLQDEELEDTEHARIRLYDLLEKRVAVKLPEQYLKGDKNPINAIQNWKRAIAVCGLRKSWEKLNPQEVVATDSAARSGRNAMIIDSVLSIGINRALDERSEAQKDYYEE